jgi:hypothetical protein
MLAPSGDQLRAGIGLKVHQAKRATQSYLRDRTNRATGTLTSYAVAAGLFAAAGSLLSLQFSSAFLHCIAGSDSSTAFSGASGSSEAC